MRIWHERADLEVMYSGVYELVKLGVYTTILDSEIGRIIDDRIEKRVVCLRIRIHRLITNMEDILKGIEGRNKVRTCCQKLSISRERFLGVVTKYTSKCRTFYHGRVVGQGFHFIAPQTVETCAIAAPLQSEMACRDNSPP
jgi:hypothetical protein